MVFFRNVQFRWMPINKGNHQLYFSVERPGASGDLGVLTDRIELQNVQARFPAPDLAAHLRWGGERGYVQVGGIGRYIAWDDLNPGKFDFSGHTWGWGVNITSNVPVGKKDVAKLAATYGYGIENYMNDGPVDVAPIPNLANARMPVDGRAVPVFGMLAFYDHYWSDRYSTSVGYSMMKLDNTILQAASAFRRGQYGLANLLYYPVKNVTVGSEFQWGRRTNFSDGFTVDDYRVQFSFKYNFNFKLGGAHFTRSHETKQEQPSTEQFLNTQIRLSDGTVIFTPNLFGPGITVNELDYRMAAFDGGLKYHGMSLDGEYYLRWLDNFSGPGTAGLASVFNHGFQMQTSTMLMPKTIQAYAGGSMVFGKFGNPWDTRLGINWFPWKNKVVRWNNEGIFLHRSPVGNSSLPYSVGATGFVFHSNFELNF